MHYNQERGDRPPGRRSRALGSRVSIPLQAATVSFLSQHLSARFISKIRELDSVTLKPFRASKFYLSAHISNYRAGLPNFLVLDGDFILYPFSFLSPNECDTPLGMPSYLSFIKLNAKVLLLN